MVDFTIRVDERRLLKQLETASSKAAPRAISAALRRAGTTTRAVAQRTIRQDVTLQAGVVRSAISIQRPSDSKLSILLIGRGGPLPLRDYQTAMTKRGATFRILRGGPRKVYKREGAAGFIPGERVQSSSLKTRRTSSRFSSSDRFGGHVFVRTGPNPPGPQKAPIKKVYGPGIAQRFRSRKVQAVVRNTYRVEFPKRLRHELQYQLRRLRGA